MAARWTPDSLASLLIAATDLSAWEGREATFEDRTRAPGVAAFAGIDDARIEFREAIAFLRQKRPRPTRAWTDALGGDHDRAFVVAGATDMAMLEEFQAAVIEAQRTRDIKAFAGEFDRIVEKFGWSYNGGREWRIRTIFDTNVRTSHMAGRIRQMRDPDVVKLRPYWQYIHGDTREPIEPRPEHVDWDQLVLRWDDPWWDIHFPPNDWRCSCGVHSLSEDGLARLGKSGPDKAPEVVRRPFTHQASGQTVMLPEGIGFGWDHMPGDLWERDLVPSALLDDPIATRIEDVRGRHLVSIDTPEPIGDLLAKTVPFKAEAMDRNLEIEDYVAAFLDPFGAGLDDAVLWQDVSGQRIVISDRIFRQPDGAWKITKRGHGEFAPLLAEAIMDPDEIWLGAREVPVKGFPGQVEIMLTRRYIRVDPDNALMTLFEIGRRGWQGVTGFAARNRKRPDFRNLDAQRIGKLLWKRK